LKNNPISLPFSLATAVIFLLSACAKSSNTLPSLGSGVNTAYLAGTWANTEYIDASAAPSEAVSITNNADTLQFDANGKLYATYYTKVFSPAVDSAVWTKFIDTAAYTLINDSALYINGHAGFYFAHLSSDTFQINTLTAHQLSLFSPNPGYGGYYYVFSK
jgi:hypothetical protein